MKFSSDLNHGLKHFYDVDVPHTAVLVSGQRTGLFGYKIENNHSAAIYVSFYDAATAGAVTVGTTSPVFTVMVPANDGVVLPPRSDSRLKDFLLGVVISASTSRNGTADVAADPTVEIWYSQN